MSDKPVLKLDWCSYAAAKYAVEHWHYSRTMPMPPRIQIGAWEGSRFVGAVIFSRGASPHLGDKFKMAQTMLCELTRVALATHRVEVSRMLAVSLLMLRRKEHGLRLVVSFADSNEGHHGGIYQAAGWIYTGRTSAKFDFRGPDGKRWRDRQVTTCGLAKQFGKVTRTLRRSDCTPIPMQGKHRYLMPLDAEMRARILPLAKPYPKRAGSIAANAATDQVADGGAAPTPALHSAG